MNFEMEMVLPSAPESIWPILFDIGRMAALVPGCEQVEEVEPLSRYVAVMRQRIGPFKLEVPTQIHVEEMQAPRQVRARASGRDKLTGTTLDVLLGVTLQPLENDRTRLDVAASMQVAGRLASLGYPMVKKRAEEIFVEFEKRLRSELGVA